MLRFVNVWPITECPQNFRWGIAAMVRCKKRLLKLGVACYTQGQLVCGCSVHF